MKERRLNASPWRRLRLLLPMMILGVLLAGTGWPSRAGAQDFAAAGQHFSSAQELFAQGKFAAAAAEFQAAYDITRDPALLLNIGESWQRASEGKKAVAAYRAFVAASPQAPERAEIDERIKAIEAALAPAEAAPTAANGSTATGATQPGPTSGSAPSGGGVNAGTGVGNTPVTDKPAATADKPSVTADKPVVTADKPAATADKPSVTVDKPSTTADKPAAQPGAAAEPAVPTDKPVITPPEEKPRRLKTAAWVSIASAVALATGGAIVGLGAQNRADELRRRTTQVVSGQPPIYDDNQREAYTALQSEGRAYNAASIALLSVAGVAAVTGGVLLVVDLVRKPKEQASAASRWSLAPILLPSQAGVAASGNF